MDTIRKNSRSIYAAVFGAFFLFGVSTTVIGAVLPRILDDFSWGYRGVGLVLAAGSIAFFIASYVAGTVIGRLGARAAFTLGFAADTLGLTLFGTVPGLVPNLILFACVGAGQGFIEVSANWSVLRMSTEESAGKTLSLIHGAFAVGAVLGPVLAGVLIASGAPWQTAFRILAALFAVMIAVTFALPFAALGREAPRAGTGHRNHSLARKSAYWLGALSLLLYVGAEYGLSNWSAEFFVRILRASPATAAMVVSVFWFGLLAGRVGIPLAFPRTRPGMLLGILSLGMVGSYALLAVTAFIGESALPVAWAAVALAGLSSSSVYPLVIGIVAGAFPDRQGEATGLASTGGGVGAFVFPFIMSNVAAALGLAAGFVVYAAVAIAGAICYRALIASADRERARRLNKSNAG